MVVFSAYDNCLKGLIQFFCNDFLPIKSSLVKLNLIMFGCLFCSPTWAENPNEIKPGLIYKENCSVCHGDKGDGRSRASTSLFPPPRNFTTASDLTRERMILTVTHGKRGTAMTSWKTQLSEQQIGAVVDYVRNNFMQEVIEQHRTTGRLVYGHNCVSCHGDRGQGVKASFFATAPRSFTASNAEKNLTRERIMAAVTNGVPGTKMLGYADILTSTNIEAVVDYTRDVLVAAAAPASDPAPASTPEIASSNSTVSGSPPSSVSTPSTSTPLEDATTVKIDMGLPLPDGLSGDNRWGEQFFMRNCATCHGTLGNGQGPRAYFMTIKPRNFLDARSRTTLNRPAIYSAIKLGRQGTEMPAWGKVLSNQEIANIAEFVFQSFIQADIK